MTALRVAVPTNPRLGDRYRSGVTATLRQSETLLQAGSDWCRTGVLENFPRTASASKLIAMLREFRLELRLQNLQQRLLDQAIFMLFQNFSTGPAAKHSQP